MTDFGTDLAGLVSELGGWDLADATALVETDRLALEFIERWDPAVQPHSKAREDVKRLAGTVRFLRACFYSRQALTPDEDGAIRALLDEVSREHL